MERQSAIQMQDRAVAGRKMGEKGRLEWKLKWSNRCGLWLLIKIIRLEKRWKARIVILSDEIDKLLRPYT